MSQPNVRAFSSGWGNFNQHIFNGGGNQGTPCCPPPVFGGNYSDPCCPPPVFGGHYSDPCCPPPVFGGNYSDPCCPPPVYGGPVWGGPVYGRPVQENVYINGGRGDDTIIVNQRTGRQVYGRQPYRQMEENVIINGGNGNDRIVVNQNSGGRQIIEERRGPVIVRQGKTECRRP